MEEHDTLSLSKLFFYIRDGESADFFERVSFEIFFILDVIFFSHPLARSERLELLQNEKKLKETQ